MVLNFENYTQPLTDKERSMIPWYVHFLMKNCYGEENAKKSHEIIPHLRGYNTNFNLEIGKIDKAFIGKMTNILRVSGTVPNLSATENGYFIATNKIDIEDCIISLRQRANSILAAADGMERGAADGNSLSHGVYDPYGQMSIRLNIPFDNKINRKACTYIELFAPFKKSLGYTRDIRVKRYKDSIKNSLRGEERTDESIKEMSNKKFYKMVEFFMKSDIYEFISHHVIKSIMDIMDGMSESLIGGNEYIEYYNKIKDKATIESLKRINK